MTDSPDMSSSAPPSSMPPASGRQMAGQPAARAGRAGRNERARGEVDLPRRALVRVTRRARFIAAVAVERRLAGPPIALGRRTSIVFGTRGVFTRGRDLSVSDGFSAVVDGHLAMGDEVFFNRDANLSVYSSVAIGDRCRFGERLSIHDEDHNIASRSHDSESDSAYLVSDVTIGDDVWVGANVTILRGSHIGAGSVIAAGAVVRGDVPPGTVAGGVPARVLRHLG